MMNGTLMDILQYLLPTGALATFFTWLIRRDVHNARSAKEKHDLYKQMYEDSQETNFNLQKDVRNLQIAFINLERAVSKAVLCKHYGDRCPVRNELQKSKGKFTTKPIGQSSDQRGTIHYPRSGTTEQSGDDAGTNESSDASSGCRIS